MSGVLHAFTSGKAAAADLTVVDGPNWDDAHYYVGDSVNVGALIYAGTSGKLTNINSVAAGQVLASAGVGSVPAWTASPSLTSVLLGDGSPSAPALAFTSSPTTGLYATGNTLVYTRTGANDAVAFGPNAGLVLRSDAPLQWSNTTNAATGTADVLNFREAAGHFFQRNSTNAQRASWANTYTSATNYEAFSVDWQTTANKARVGTRTAATGTGRELLLVAQNDNAADSYATLRLAAGPALPVFRAGLFTAALANVSSAAAGTWFSLGEFTSTATSGTVINTAILPTYNQTSGTAANTDLLIKRTKTAVGSGLQKFIDAQVGSTVTFSVYDDGTIYTKGVAFASLPAAPIVGMLAYVSDSSTATWGASIAGGGVNKVLAFYNGTNWTVTGV